MPATRIPCSLPGFIEFEIRGGRQQVPWPRRCARGCRDGQSWAEEARDGRRAQGLLAHPLGQLGARARAAPAALLRPPRLAQRSRPTDLPVCAALPRSLTVLRLRRRGGGGGGGGDGARGVEAIKLLEIFARLRRAEDFARLRRAAGARLGLLWLMRRSCACVSSSVFAVGGVVVRGVVGGQNFFIAEIDRSQRAECGSAARFDFFAQL
jgi:hypothetical protein